MKSITLGLAAALAFSLAPVQAASPITFTINAESGAGALRENNFFTYTYFEGGDRLNVKTVFRDETAIYGDRRYVSHVSETTYDQQGAYRDAAYWTFSTGNAAHAPDYIYFKASASISPDVNRTAPITITASGYVEGTYTSASDPRFPNVSLHSGAVTIAAAESHDPAELTTSYGGPAWFNPDGSFSTSYSGDVVIPAGGSVDIGLLFYFPAQLHATSYSLRLISSPYDEGLRHFTDRTLLGFDVSPVPEPSTWAMLLAGVGIVGVARRRKTAA